MSELCDLIVAPINRYWRFMHCSNASNRQDYLFPSRGEVSNETELQECYVHIYFECYMINVQMQI